MPASKLDRYLVPATHGVSDPSKSFCSLAKKVFSRDFLEKNRRFSSDEC
jgi:hypothetical protein